MAALTLVLASACGGAKISDVEGPAEPTDPGADASGDHEGIQPINQDDGGIEVEAGTKVVNGCNRFVDRAGTKNRIIFPDDKTVTPYTPPCVQIAVGETVNWRGSFEAHPLAPKGGDPGSPIVLTAKGTAQSFTFEKPGTFGFVSPQDAEVMRGAIRVVP